ncbi:MAG: DUF1552 domain-containing protein [Deltaproteobacteria bacterium]|nr:DUF1552 domain-containing protein [Deltaproteobacteria bacterium]
MSLTHINRRKFLVGASSLPLALPLLPQVTRAAPASGVKNLIVFWVPDGSPTDPAGSRKTLLARHRKNVAVITNSQHTAYEREYGSEEHPNGPRTLLTGGQNGPDRVANGVKVPAGRSADQIVGSVLGGSAIFPTYELGSWGSNMKDGVRYISFESRGKPRVPSYNPVKSYADLLSGLAPSGNDADALAARERTRRTLLMRGSLLDSLVPELKRTCEAVGSSGRDSLDAYLTSVRAVEKRTKAMLEQGMGMASPSALPKLDNRWGEAAFYQDDKNFNVVGEANMRIAAAALAAGTTRAITFHWGTTGPTTVPDWLPNRKLKGVYHHRLSHPKEHPKDVSFADRQMLYQWYEEQLAFLLDRLAEIDMGGQTLLDQTVVLRLSESNNNGHATNDLPVSVSGGSSVFAVGSDHDLKGRSVCDVITAVLQGLGIQMDALGRPDSNAGAYTALLR